MLSPDACITIGVVGVVFLAMARGWATPDVVLMSGAIFLAALGIIEPDQLLQGFANHGMLTIAAMFVVAAGLRETGALDRLGSRMLGASRTGRQVFTRLGPQVTLLSGFLNNTAVVAMLLPIITDWCRRNRVAPSRLLLPLSYVTVLGGTCTLIGTSTNLIVDGLLDQVTAEVAPDARPPGLRGLGFFEPAAVGLAAVVLGFLYLALLGRRWLPDRRELLEHFGEAPREYLVNVRVEPHCPLVGRTVEHAGLRRLPGLFLIEIVRKDQLIAPVRPDEGLRAGDHLTFTGVVSTIVDLERIPGLVAEEHAADEPNNVPEPQRRYCEAVISGTSPLIGRNIREANFRALYNAAVIAVHRNGAKLTGRVGDIVLRQGDTLLLQTDPHFVQAHYNNADFYLVSGLDAARPVRRQRSALSLGLLGVLIILLVTGFLPVVVSALLIAGLMVLFGCVSGGEARRQVRWDVLLAIGAALAIGEALGSSGAAEGIAQYVSSLTGPWGPVAALAAIYLLTMILTEVMTNSAAAALVFPMALSVATQLGVDPRPLVMAVIFGASFGFASPIGYQTHMMIFGPGGYRFSDFVRVGLPLDLLLWGLVTLLVPIIWPFAPN